MYFSLFCACTKGQASWKLGSVPLCHSDDKKAYTIFASYLGHIIIRQGNKEKNWRHPDICVGFLNIVIGRKKFRGGKLLLFSFDPIFTPITEYHWTS